MQGKRRKRAGRKQALLILDLISEFEFDDWRRILAVAQRIAPRISRLKARASAAKVPVISGSSPCLRTIIFKPKHSAFYATPLAELLGKLGAKELTQRPRCGR